MTDIQKDLFDKLYIELDFNNLLLKNKDVDYFRREIKITYIGHQLNLVFQRRTP